MSDFFNWCVQNWRYLLYMWILLFLMAAITFKMQAWQESDRGRNIILPSLIALLLVHLIIAVTWDIGKQDDMLMLSFLFLGNFGLYFHTKKREV